MGAAVCAGVGVGMYPDFSVMEKLNRTEYVIEPNPENSAVYEKMYDIFNASYEALVHVYGSLADYRRTEETEQRDGRK